MNFHFGGTVTAQNFETIYSRQNSSAKVQFLGGKMKFKAEIQTIAEEIETIAEEIQTIAEKIQTIAEEICRLMYFLYNFLSQTP